MDFYDWIKDFTPEELEEGFGHLDDKINEDNWEFY